MTDLAERAQWIADNVLFPDAASVDASGVVPESVGSRSRVRWPIRRA